MDFENSKQPSREEMAKIEKQRTLNDWLLLMGGAEYQIDDKGNKTLELTADQIGEAMKEMDASRMNNAMDNAKKLEELQDVARAGNYEEALNIVHVFTNLSSGQGGIPLHPSLRRRLRSSFRARVIQNAKQFAF